MVVSREINWQKLILSFLIACFLFSFGIFVGYLAKQIVVGTTISLQESIRNELVNIETVELLGKDNVCANGVVNIISEKLDYTGELISLLEIKKGKTDPEVLELKKLYTNLEVRHMLIMQQKKIQCEQNYTLFLFFYSNEKECKDNVEKTSFILSYLRKKYDSVRVYSFDSNLNSDVIRILKEKYLVDSCSVVVINDKKVNATISNSNDLEKLF